MNGWLFIRYLVVGLYVGLATILGFLWWFMLYPQVGGWVQALSTGRQGRSGGVARPAQPYPTVPATHCVCEGG